MHPKTTNPELKYFVFIITALIANSLLISGQNIEKISKKAYQLFEDEKYEKAAKQYLKIVNSGSYYEDAYVQLSRCYSNVERYDAANTYFSQIFTQSASVDPAYFLEYGQLLLIMGRNDEARSYFTSYNNLLEINDLRVLRYIKSIEDIDKYYLDSSFIQLQKLELSSQGDDQNPLVYDQVLLFETNKDLINSSPAENELYYHSLNELTQKKSDKISGNLAENNRSYGFAVATSTGELYRTIRDDNISTNRILLFRSFIENNGSHLSKGEQVIPEGWEDNIAYPAVNSTGNILVFSSDSKKAKGGWDLFISYRGTYGYSQPIVLPGFTNTEGDEKYPYLLNDSILFFASDGHGGLGGYDIYYININNFSELPKNLGYPINTRFNEFGLALNGDRSLGFVSSDRAPEESLADIYSFTISQIRAIGVVTDQNTGENLKNVAVEVRREGEEATHLMLADNGRFTIEGAPEDRYNLTVWREGYTLETYSVNTGQGVNIGLYEVDIGYFPIEPTDITFQSPIPEEPDTMWVKQEPVTVVVPIVVEPEPVIVPTGLTVFRLQIAASRLPLSEAQIRNKYKGSRDVFMFQEEGWYKYAIGEYSSFFEANNARKTCGVGDAFIAAYNSSGEKLALSSAIREVHSRPTQPEGQSEIVDRNIVKTGTIYFSFDLYEPADSEMQKLTEFLGSLNSDPELKVEIKGHSDNQGSSAYNFGLSEARADFIKKYFIEKGISSERINVISFGEKQLQQVCDTDCTPAIHRANRRAEVFLYK